MKKLVIPLSDNEKRNIRNELRSNGSTKAVRVWRNIILSDFEYYDYCHKYEIPFSILSIPLSSQEEAEAWICRDQLARKSLPGNMRKYLLGKLSTLEINLGQKYYDSIKKRGGAIQSSKPVPYDSSATKTRKRLSSVYGINYITISKYESFAANLDKVHAADPDFALSFLNEKIQYTIPKINAISGLSPYEIQAEYDRIKEDGQTSGSSPQKGKGKSIKDMPAYDPDAEISSLALTIPSWISSINRVRKTARLSETSEAAVEKLEDALGSLIETSAMMQDEMRKEKNGKQQ